MTHGNSVTEMKVLEICLQTEIISLRCLAFAGEHGIRE
jgi:hypothetical protein